MDGRTGGKAAHPSSLGPLSANCGESESGHRSPILSYGALILGPSELFEAWALPAEGVPQEIQAVLIFGDTCSCVFVGTYVLKFRIISQGIVAICGEGENGLEAQS